MAAKKLTKKGKEPTAASEMTAKKTPPAKKKASYKKLHFIFATSKGKELEAKFARKLIKALGQVPLEKADAIISVGGDGLLLETLRKDLGKPIYGIKAPGSASRAFWLDKDVTSAEKLVKNLAESHPLNLMQLQAEITFANGRKKICRAFNEVAIERDGPQSAKMFLRATFNGCAVKSPEFIGDGVVFATPMGSTGTNRTLGGPIADIRNKVVLVTPKCAYEPRGVAPAVMDVTATVFEALLLESEKRPVRVDFDGKAILKDEDGSRITSVKISAARKKGGTLLVTKEPALRAFKTMWR